MRQWRALNNVITEYSVHPRRCRRDLDCALIAYRKTFQTKLKDGLKRHRNIRFQVSAQTKLIKYKFETLEFITITPWFSSDVKPILYKRTINRYLKEASAKIISFFDSFLESGSGWVLDKVSEIKLTVMKYRPLGGGNFHQLPREIMSKHACLNIKCALREMCFLYCVLASLFPAKNRNNQNRPRQYHKYISKLKLTGLKFPVDITQIPLFEELNTISINVYGFEKTIYPVYITQNRNSKHHINLLLYRHHFFLVKNLSALLSKYYHSWGKKMYYCHFCLTGFYEPDRCHDHTKVCPRDGQTYRLPPPKSYLQFKNLRNKIRAPFVIYLDMESFNKKINSVHGKSVRRTEHIAMSFCGIRVCIEPKYTSKPFTYVGTNCIRHLVRYLWSQNATILSILESNRMPMKFTKDDECRFKKAKHCYICDKKFKNRSDKVRDHSHLSGVFINASCQVCNLHHSALKSNYKLPVIVHGGSNYDTHLLIKEIYDVIGTQVKVIPKTTERYLSIQFENFVFIDSYQFLFGSLESLADTLLQSGEEKFRYTKSQFKDPNQLRYLFRKGVLPYEYIDSWKKLSQRCLPSRKDFYSNVKGAHISKEDYLHARNVYTIFKCCTLMDYLVLYLKVDTILLVDIFESFRDDCLNYYKLDPVRYLSCSHLAFDCMLLMTSIKLELISDLETYELFENMIRGGIVTVPTRYARANNKMMQTYDPSKPTSYIMFIDANGLYSKTMTYKLPYKNFKFLLRKWKNSKWSTSQMTDMWVISCVLILNIQKNCTHPLSTIHTLLHLRNHKFT